jgi:hypothetical protein
MRAYPSTVITLTIAIPIAVLVLTFAAAAERHDRERAAADTSAEVTTTTTAVPATATTESTTTTGVTDETAATDAPATTVAAPRTASRNTAHPPPADVQLGGCSTHEYAGAAANGTLTNNSSKLSNYVISVNFADDAGVIVANATAFAHDIPAGASATWEALSFDDSSYATCALVKVDRFSAVG